MKRNRFFGFVLLLLLAGNFSAAQSREEIIREYINTYKQIAIEEMNRSGVPASIKLAQGIHETEAGRSNLVLLSNNHFGIKCKSNWTGESVRHTDDAPNECFRKYDQAADSYRDHSDFLKNNQRYAFLFQLDPEDYQGWAYGLKKAGYATNPKYPQIIIKLIEEFQLNDYTLIALGKKQPEPEMGIGVADIKKEEPVNPEPDVAIDEPAPVYPEGEFRLNETRVVFVKAGTAYLTVADQYQIPLARIFEFNEMNETEVAEKDQLIYLQRKRKTGANQTHRVLPGENLHSIAQKEAIRLASLLEYNFLGRGMQPAPGEILYLRSQAPARPRLVDTK